jgi:translation initiation factor IF-1
LKEMVTLGFDSPHFHNIMSSSELRAEGVVTERLPDGKYRVLLDNGKDIIAYSSGKIRLHNVRILEGDRVEVVLDPYGGKATNRLVFRFLPKK